MSLKPVLGIDIDDVLAANAAGFVKFSNERWGTNLTVDDYDEHWASVWKVDEAETRKRALELHESGTFGRYEHFPDAKEVLQQLHDKFTIIAVTSRRRLIEVETRAWIKRYFDGVIDDIMFAGFYDRTDGDVQTMRAMTKADLLQSLKVEYFIDDQLKHCLAAAAIDINTILFGDYKWNQRAELPERVARCANWRAVKNYFQL